MSNDSSVVHWLDAHHTLTRVELRSLSGLSETELTELVECGVIAAEDAGEEYRFTAECLVIARTAARLRTDFDLQSGGLALAVRLLDRIRDLELQLQDLRARTPTYPGR